MKSSVHELQETLVARGVLSYTPSLSPAVYDALNSYWRLPVSERAALRSDLSDVVSSSGASAAAKVDWTRWLGVVDGSSVAQGINAVETAWSLALLVEEAMSPMLNDMGSDDPRSPPAAWVELAASVLTHGEKLGSLCELMSVERGDYYMGFLVAVTVLERALYDLHGQHAQIEVDEMATTKLDKEKRASQIKSKSMILRDLLESETLTRVLPAGLRRLLNIMFLPSGLNLRNLVWHGFVVPAEFPRCFGCLVLLVTLQLLPFFESGSTQSMKGTSESLFQLSSYDGRFVLRSDPSNPDTGVLKLLQARTSAATGDAVELWLSKTSFVPRGRVHLVRRALTVLITTGDELWFLFAFLPVLEYALRLEFLRSNQARWAMSSEYSKAQIDAYYSTLDGFGQKDKHQVLLYPEVIVDTQSDESTARPSTSPAKRPNALYEDIPNGALAVFLDLFMMAVGPNIRAKLCHGEADLTTFLSKPDGEYPPTRPPSDITKTLVAAFVVMCEYRLIDLPESGQPLSLETKHGLVSSFHPFFRIYREIRACFGLCGSFAKFCEASTKFTKEETDEGDQGDPVTRLVFGADADTVEEGGDGYVIVEKSSRVAQLEGTGVQTSKKSFAYLIKEVNSRLDKLEQLIQDHFAKHHSVASSGSALFALLEARDGKHSSQNGYCVEERSIETNPVMSRRLLALGDADGLSVASCMLETVASIQRSLEHLQLRVRQLQKLIIEGKARTNHRRSFLSNVFFLRVFERVQLVCLSMVEHHAVHMFEMASRSSSSAENVDLHDCGCPKAASFERIQHKLLQFITAFEGCTGSPEAAQKSIEKSLELAVQFFDSKPVRAIAA